MNLLGINVPKYEQILIDVLAMGSDPTIWKNLNIFMSERFLEGDINYKGNNFEFIPFGAGRIICSGLPFAHRTASN